jgi:DNA-binding XRE family transcriptional regulator
MIREKRPFAPLGDALTALREVQGLDAQEVARRVPVPRQTLFNWETGRHCPNLISFIDLMGALGATFQDLSAALVFARESRELRERHLGSIGGTMAKKEKKTNKGPEKPVSLDPLEFEEALQALLKVRPEDAKTKATTASKEDKDSKG